MAIANAKHLSPGRVEFLLAGGIRLDTMVRCNDPVGRRNGKTRQLGTVRRLPP
jgi:hypothetical protein